MRLTMILGATALLGVYGFLTPAAAASKAVADCLASSAYLDGGETYEFCDKALKESGLTNETLSAINRQIGEAFYFAQRPGPALAYLDTAIKLDPKSGQAYRRRGWAYSRLEKMSAAIADFTEFLNLKPDDPDAQYAMAYAQYGKANNCAAVVKEYERILSKHPNHYLVRSMLAVGYACIDNHQMRELAELNRILAAGREAVAEAEYYGRRGRADRDFYAKLIDQRAGIYYETGQSDKAIVDYSWLIENYPSHPLTYLNRADMRLGIRDYGGALTDADKALSIIPDRVDGQVVRMRALNGLKRSAESIDYANSVLSRGYVAPQTPEIQFYRAIALKRLGRKDEAAEDFNRVMAASEALTWSLHTQLTQSGYVFGPLRNRTFDDGGPPLNPQVKEFKNALAACLIDPECMK
jgi:tetratricopeptide (TPR) repeat protein